MRLNSLAHRQAELFETLAAAERNRARRLLDPTAATHFIAARGVLRELLAGYLDQHPAEVELRYQEQGKPFLSTPEPLHFNVSHAQGHALLVFSTSTPLGVDLEQVRPLRHAERTAHRVFDANDLREWMALPPEERVEGFFRRWTRLEATAKLLGTGVWKLLEAREHGYDPPRYAELQVPSGFVATLAHQQQRPRILTFDWEESG